MSYSHLGKSPTVISHNVNSLNIPEKRTKLLRELKKVNPSVIFIQETYFKGQNIPKLTDTLFTKAYHATNPLAKTKGVSILLNKHSPFVLSGQLIDPEGRYIFLKGSWGGDAGHTGECVFPKLRAHHILYQNCLRTEMVCRGLYHPRGRL